MNTLFNDVKSLVSNEYGCVERIREWPEAQMKHCIKYFNKFDNTTETSMELVNGFYGEGMDMKMQIEDNMMPPRDRIRDLDNLPNTVVLDHPLFTSGTYKVTENPRTEFNSLYF